MSKSLTDELLQMARLPTSEVLKYKGDLLPDTYAFGWTSAFFLAATKSFRDEEGSFRSLAEAEAFLREVEPFLKWWGNLRAGSSITFDVEAFRVKLSKWLDSRTEMEVVPKGTEESANLTRDNAQREQEQGL